MIGFFSNFAAAALWAAQIDNEAALEDFGQVICTSRRPITGHPMRAKEPVRERSERDERERSVRDGASVTEPVRESQCKR